jgi:hypothetical protein
VLVLRNFVVLFPVIFTEFRFLVFHRVGSFNKVIAGVNKLKKTTPKLLVLYSVLFGTIIITSAFQVVLSPYPFIRTANVILIIFLSGVGRIFNEREDTDFFGRDLNWKHSVEGACILL